jgi:hypothetical protein
MHIKQKWLLLAGAVLVVGVGVAWWQGKRNEVFEIVRTSTGGITGRGDGGNFTLTNADLDAAQQQEVVREVYKTHFFETNAKYTAPGCADQFITTLKVQVDGRAHAVTFEDCGQKDLPAEVIELDKYLRRLAPD